MALRTRTALRVLAPWRENSLCRGARPARMRPLRYSINVTLDGCCHHLSVPPGEDLHRHVIENFERADALLFGRVTYGMMEEGWRWPAPAGARPAWMEPFARTIGSMKKYVVSSR